VPLRRAAAGRIETQFHRLLDCSISFAPAVNVADAIAGEREDFEKL